MNLYLWPVVIFVTAVTVLLGVGWWITRNDQVERLADPEPLPGEPGYGRFPADTGPLLLLSEAAAAVEAHEREVQAMIRRADELGMMP